MYTIIMNDDKSLTTSIRKTLYQREKLADKIQFLIPQKYGVMDLSKCTAKLKYIDQGNISRSELLAKDSELYKDRLRFLLPVDNKLNYFAGNISIRIIFTNKEMGQELRTGDCIITIEPSGIIEEENSTESSSEVNEKIVALENQIKELQENQANDLKLTDDLLQLSIDGETIGEGVTLPKKGSADADLDDDGDVVIDLDNQTSSDYLGDENTVVEF